MSLQHVVNHTDDTSNGDLHAPLLDKEAQGHSHVFPKARVEAFSDGVLAIIVTVMVLDLKAPEGSNWLDLGPFLHELVTYCLSFIYVGIYWLNHHALLHAAERVSYGVLVANLNLLFWLSLLPFSTDWVGYSASLQDLADLPAAPMAVYGITLFMPALSFTILARTLAHADPSNHRLRLLSKVTIKSAVSTALYLAGIGLAFVQPWVSAAIFVLVAIAWLIPTKH